MFFSHLNKEIMLLKLKMKKIFFINYFIISLKRSYRNFDVILKTYFKRIKFILDFLYRNVYFFYIEKE